MIDAGRMGQECFRSLSPVLGDLHPQEVASELPFVLGGVQNLSGNRLSTISHPQRCTKRNEHFLSLPKVRTFPHLLLGLKNITLGFSESSI